MKVDLESSKKTQIERKLEMKRIRNLNRDIRGKLHASCLTNVMQKMEERILGIEHRQKK